MIDKYVGSTGSQWSQGIAARGILLFRSMFYEQISDCTEVFLMRQQKGSVAVLILRVHTRSTPQQNLNHLLVFVNHGLMERKKTKVLARVDVRASGQEQSRQLATIIEHCQTQRRPFKLGNLGIDVGRTRQ